MRKNINLKGFSLSPPELRGFLVPVLVILITLSLGSTIGWKLIGRLLDLRSKISTVELENKGLSAKADHLKSLDVGLLTHQATVVVSAIPHESSSLSSLASIRSLAFAKQLQLNNFTLSEGKSGSDSVSHDVVLSFEVSGSFSGILDFFSSIGQYAPVMEVRNVKLSGSGFGGSFSGKTDLSSFWASLPKDLPPADKSLESLSPTEQALFTTFDNLKSPVFQSDSSSTGAGSGRENPFAD